MPFGLHKDTITISVIAKSIQLNLFFNILLMLSFIDPQVDENKSRDVVIADKTSMYSNRVHIPTDNTNDSKKYIICFFTRKSTF